MKTEDSNPKHLIAEPGKVLRRLTDGWIAGAEITLGYSYRMGGALLDEPLLELPEHYEEIDAPIEDESIVEESLTPAEETQLAESEPDPVGLTTDFRTYEQRVIQIIRSRYSISDEIAILRQRDTKPEEFCEYFEFCECCKAKAKMI